MSRHFEWTAVPDPPPNLPSGSIGLTLVKALAHGALAAPDEDVLDSEFPIHVGQNDIPRLHDYAKVALATGREDWADAVALAYVLGLFPGIRIEVVR